MSDEIIFDPLKGYDPQDIDVSEIKELGFTDEMVDQLLAQIRKDLSGVIKVKDVLKTLVPIGKLVIKIAADSASGGLGSKLSGIL